MLIGVGDGAAPGVEKPEGGSHDDPPLVGANRTPARMLEKGLKLRYMLRKVAAGEDSKRPRS
jgi:hypothetical protein